MASIPNRPLVAAPAPMAWAMRVLGQVAAWNDARQTRDALTRLTDRELDDLGLTRGDIEPIASGAPRR